MCLHFINSDAIEDKIKDTIPEGGTKVYKVVEIRYGKYYPLYQNQHVPFVEGINKAETQNYIIPFRGGIYQAGFHFWLTKKAAKECCISLCKQTKSDKFVIIECEIKKEWITTIGKNEIHGSIMRRTIVTDRAVFPAYKEKE